MNAHIQLEDSGKPKEGRRKECLGRVKTIIFKFFFFFFEAFTGLFGTFSEKIIPLSVGAWYISISLYDNNQPFKFYIKLLILTC